MNRKFTLILPVLLAGSCFLSSQVPGPEARHSMGLWRSPSPYPVPYTPMEQDAIEAVMVRVLDYLEEASPIRLVDLDTLERLPAESGWPLHPGLESSYFSLISYEWGVTYAGMINSWKATGRQGFARFVQDRFDVMERLGKHYVSIPESDRPRRYPMGRMIKPRSLDNCGAMAAALIKGKSEGLGHDTDVLFVPSLHYISTGQYRLSDGTLARNRPMADSLWLDDMYMSIPALAQMGHFTRDMRYFDDAAAQVQQFASRMFVETEGLFMHGWVQGMEEHPFFPWGRANGWATMAMAELLSVLPEDHPDYGKILDLYRKHITGIVRHQGVNGLWHQLLDRPATYEETSASAMFVFSIARGINRGWLDPLAFGPAASLGWNAVSQKVNELGQVEGTCVGTGMGWDPAFYAYRITSVYAAHGYGPVLLAGAEMILLREGAGSKAKVHDGGVHFGETPGW